MKSNLKFITFKYYLMKRAFLLLMASSTLFLVHCNPKDEKDADNEKSSKLQDNDAEEEKTEKSSSNIEKAAAGYCDCFNNSSEELDPKMKRMIIKAGESDNPLQVIQTEMMKIKDPEEQQRLGQQIQAFTEGSAIEDCTNKITKRYKLNDKDPKMQRQVVKALEDNEDCELVSALMKIGINQANTNGSNKLSDEE